LDQMSAREFLNAFDEELGRLAPQYREALVLCCLEGLARDEAAARLCVSRATLKSRLERGRKRLADALTKRGVALGAGFLAWAAISTAGTSPSRLRFAIQAAIAGDIPPSVATLAKGVAVNAVIKKSFVGAVLMVATIGVGLGIGEPTSTTAG